MALNNVDELKLEIVFISITSNWNANIIVFQVNIAKDDLKVNQWNST